MTSSDLPNLSKLAKPDPRKEPKCKPFYASDIPELESHNRLLAWRGLTAHEILKRKVIDKHGFWLFKWEDGNEYPLYKLDISSASHPFYTGNQKIVDTEGRVERFMKKYNLNKK